MDRRNILKTGLAASIMGHAKMSFSKTGAGHVVLPEVHRHERTFMQWPVSRDVYPDPYFLEMVQQTIADIANYVGAFDTHDALLTAGIELDVIFEPNKRRVDDIEFVASYANYYVCNGAVIAAEFGDPEMDQIAVEALGRHFPGREILTLNVDTLGEVGGGIHCATHEMPVV